MHPRNRHQQRYDFPALTCAVPALSNYVVRTPEGQSSIDFANPAAVRTLNQALLKQFYGVDHWSLPEGYLCPPIPGRADYVHAVADLLSPASVGERPGPSTTLILDIGTGASCIYPLLGYAEYGWHFVASDIDRHALASAQRILDANHGPRAAIEVRLQEDPSTLLMGVIKTGEQFDLTVCNPPFHASAGAALKGSQAKWQKLGRADRANDRPVLNFGGKGHELWCPGGELGFVRRLITESASVPASAKWFTSLISKGENLDPLQQHLTRVGARQVRQIPISHGQKQSRILAWSFSASSNG